MSEVQNHKRWKPVVKTKTLFPQQLTLLIANPVNWHVFCEGSHYSDACFKAQKKSIEEKQDITNKKNVALHVLKLDTSREGAEPS